MRSTGRLLLSCVLLLFLANRSDSQSQLDEQSRKKVQLLEYENENYGADGYEFYYETDDGTSRQESGSFVKPLQIPSYGPRQEESSVEGIWTVVGRSEWRDPDGNVFVAEYTADDKGYNVKLRQMFAWKPGTQGAASFGSAGAGAGASAGSSFGSSQRGSSSSSSSGQGYQTGTFSSSAGYSPPVISVAAKKSLADANSVGVPPSRGQRLKIKRIKSYKN